MVGNTRIEHGSSLMLDDASAICAVGAFLCYCSGYQIMSNNTAIEKKFQQTKFPTGLSSNEPRNLGRRDFLI